MDRRFCSQCGKALERSTEGSEHPPSPRRPASFPTATAGSGLAPPTAERRRCSVLFVDLVGFTALSASRDPEDVREILSSYFDLARTVIRRHGGIVEKFIGDAVMAVWGAPVATEDDGERAVRAALELVAAVEALGPDVGVEGIRARAGIVTGEVAVQLGVAGEGMVAGDTVNTASRLQGVASPGSVFVDGATRRLAEAAVSFRDEGVYELKGKEEPERLHRAMRVLGGVGGSQRSDALEAPFMGRDTELRALKDLFHTTAGRREARIVVVSGPAGVGKSRLGWELEKYVDGIAEAVLWHRGRCLSYGNGVSFWALAEIVRQRFGIAEGDSTEAAVSKLDEGMVRFVADPEERSFIGIRLSRLLGIPYRSDDRAEPSQADLYAGWRLFFEHLAQVAPVAIAVEDAHQADEALLGFFSHLVEWSRGLPIFVVLLARPGSPTLHPGYGVGRNRATLSLDPLDSTSIEAIVASLVPGLPAAALHSIAQRAEGVALFAVETIRSLIDRGVVRRDGSGYELAGSLEALEDLHVPDTLHALLAARLDDLPAPLRSLVAVASVLGDSFPKESLAAVAQQNPLAVQEALDELVRRDVLEIRADPKSPERGAYRFSQEMLRQVAYRTLARRDRKAHHVAVAAHLRTVFANDGEEIADVIARHYLDAISLSAGTAGGRTEGADGSRDALAAEALAFLIRAAERAERIGAPSRAAEAFAAAAELAPPPQAALALERAAIASYGHGDHDAALLHIRAARAQHLAGGDTRAAARAQSIEGRVLQDLGCSSAARVELAEAVAVLRSTPDVDTVEALRRLANIEIFTGNVADGERLLAEAFALAQSGDVDIDTLTVARLYDSKATVALFANQPIEASAYYEAAIGAAERSGQSATATAIQYNLADLLARTDPRRAAEVAKGAADNARRLGRGPDLGLAVANMAIALLELGEWDEAGAALRQVEEQDHVEDEDVIRLTGWLAGLRGDPAGVAEALGRMPAMRANEEAQARASIGFLRALGASAAGNRRVALDSIMDVLALNGVIGVGHESQRWGWPLAARTARQLGERAVMDTLDGMLDQHPAGHLPPVLRAQRQLARALAAADERAPGALTAVREALVTLREAGNPYHLAHALADFADLLVEYGKEGRDPDADRSAVEASEARAEVGRIAQRLRCHPLAERAGAGAGAGADAGAGAGAGADAGAGAGGTVLHAPSAGTT
jgi:class 3 adenylate cyclase/predicted ATPase